MTIDDGSEYCEVGGVKFAVHAAVPLMMRSSSIQTVTARPPQAGRCEDGYKLQHAAR